VETTCTGALTFAVPYFGLHFSVSFIAKAFLSIIIHHFFLINFLKINFKKLLFFSFSIRRFSRVWRFFPKKLAYSYTEKSKFPKFSKFFCRQEIRQKLITEVCDPLDFLFIYFILFYFKKNL
jgi:hypothetical protein